MSPRTVRRLVLVVFIGGIAGMILGSILDNNGVAITFGLVTAAAALGLILVTSVVDPEAFRKPGGDPITSVTAADPGPDAEAAGALIEEQVELLITHGAAEAEVRELVRRSITFGRRPTRP